MHYVALVTADVTPAPPSLGRPRLLDDDTVLDAALEAFAVHGYDGMSLRMLNRELGLSHATVNQRFGSKEALYHAAVDHGFRRLLSDMNAMLEAGAIPDDTLEQLRWRLRAFLLAAARRPYIGRLLNHEGLAPSTRLDHIFDRHVEPSLRVTIGLIDQLVGAGVVHPVSPRMLFFVIIHGGATAFTLGGLSRKFDPVCGPSDSEALAAEITDFLIRGLLR